MPTKHRHRYRIHSQCGNTLTLRCSCGQERERAVTLKEEYIGQQIDTAASKDTHHVWHEWCRRFQNDQGQYVVGGYDLMQAADKFAEEFPDMVDVCRIDDAYFASSSLVVIHHGHGDNYMGASCVVISQCAPYDPVDFFTYPGHALNVMEAMNEVVKRAGGGAAVKSFRNRYKGSPSRFDAFNPSNILKKKWYAERAPHILEMADPAFIPPEKTVCTKCGDRFYPHHAIDGCPACAWEKVVQDRKQPSKVEEVTSTP